MGQEIDDREYVDERTFLKRLREETRLVARTYKQGGFQQFDRPMIGAEVEAWLLDENWLPAPENDAFLKAYDQPLATHELARFNFELNLDPAILANGLPALKDQLDALWADGTRTAEDMGLKPLMIGIPPTLIQDMLSLDTMTPSNRYKALNERVMKVRGKPTEVDIARRERLELAQNHLMIEAACTSLQTHLTVNPGPDEARLYNAAQIAAAPVTAISANSPFLYGRRLWEETRIPAFEQAIAIPSFRGRDGANIQRVTFGAGWLRSSLMELFLENLDGHDALLPLLEEAEPEALRHLKLQNGTLWRWNRPIIGGDCTGTPHLRIENRVTPAGPTPVDLVANAAFFVGLTLHLAALDPAPEHKMDFAEARGNFYACARRGLGATLNWIDGEAHDVQRLIHEELADAARSGLVAAGVSEIEARRFLEPIRGGPKTGRNGAAWQRNWVNCHGRDFQGLVAAYYEHQQSGRPVHTWRIEFRIDRLTSLPDLTGTPARDVRTIFPESTLISLDGQDPQPLFVSVLIHGNETVGWEALKRLQAWMAGHPLPRSMLIFIGNVRAAELALRMVPDRPDYNRIWRSGETPEHDLAARVTAIIREARPFAAIDLHNNTGANPHYALVHHERAEDLQLTSLFSPHAMMTNNPPGTCSEAMSAFCPAITAECGQSGVAANEEAAFNLVLDALHLDHWRGAPDLEMDLYTVRGRVLVDPEARMVFEHGAPGDVEFPANLEKWNFFDRPAGSTFARLPNGKNPVRVTTHTGEDVTDDCFVQDGDRLILTRDFTPAMLTTNETAIRADCLGYLMEKKG